MNDRAYLGAKPTIAVQRQSDGKHSSQTTRRMSSTSATETFKWPIAAFAQHKRGQTNSKLSFVSAGTETDTTTNANSL
jgi:hypothetical protein